MAKPGCGACGNNPQPVSLPPQFATMAEWFDRSKTNPSDFHEHMETLRDFAARCAHVSQIGIWGKPSRVALAVGVDSSRLVTVPDSNADPKTSVNFVDYSPSKRPEWAELKRFYGDHFEGREWPDTGLVIDKTDLLFIDTYHTAEETHNLLTKHAPMVQKYLVVHTAETFGEQGDNGSPGVLHGIRKFVHDNREWTVIRHDKNNHGLIVLSRLDEDRKTPPGTLRKALNFSKALMAHAKAGQKLVEDDVYESRIELCLLCPDRAHDVCSKCGCPIDKKASWAEQSCPVGKWTGIA